MCTVFSNMSSSSKTALGARQHNSAADSSEGLRYLHKTAGPSLLQMPCKEGSAKALSGSISLHRFACTSSTATVSNKSCCPGTLHFYSDSNRRAVHPGDDLRKLQCLRATPCVKQTACVSFRVALDFESPCSNGIARTPWCHWIETYLAKL